jgi:hypothetical protein
MKTASPSNRNSNSKLVNCGTPLLKMDRAVATGQSSPVSLDVLPFMYAVSETPDRLGLPVPDVESLTM